MSDHQSKFMAKTIEIAASNPIAPYGALIVYVEAKRLRHLTVN